MNHKERIDAVMNFQPVDRTPFALVDGGAWVAKHEGLTYRELYSMPDGGASIIAKYMDDIDTDSIGGVNGVFTAPLNAFGCEIDIDHSGSPVNTKDCIKDLDEFLAKYNKDNVRETLLSCEFFQQMLNQCENIKKEVGDEKYIHVDIAGPFTNACVLLGTAEYMMLLVKDKEKAAQLLDLGTAICIEVLNQLRARGADITFIAEPCSSGTMISPKMFKSIVLPRLLEVKEATDYTYYMVHICGGSGKRVAPLAEAGFNAFSCDYAVDLAQALEDADGKMVIFGNINPAGALLFEGPDEVYNEVKANIDIAKGKGYIVAPGCDLGCDSEFENVLALSRAAKEVAI